MHYLSIILCLIASVNTYSQQTTAENPATSILHEIESRVQGMEAVEYDFTLNINFPEQETIVQNGMYLQSGPKYFLELPAMISLSDGKDQWLIDKELQEVQIHDFEEEDKENILNPTNLLSLYANPDFEYALLSNGQGGNQSIQRIEFKPNDKYSEYSKARMTIDRAGKKIERVEVFGKDGTVYDLVVNKMTPISNPSPQTFEFNQSDYPNYHIEDLRIN